MVNPTRSLIDPTFPFASSGREPAAGKLEPDYSDVFHAWKAADNPATRGALLTKVKPVLDSAVYSYAGAGASPHVKGQAKLMALKAFGSYDPNKGNMKTHLLSQLRSLQRVSAQGNQIISIPERVALDRRHMMETEGQLRDSLGRDPSDMEVASRTGLSLKRLGYIRGAASGVNSGSILDEDGEVHSPASTIPGAQGKDDAWAEMIYYDLGDIDRTIMDYTLGLRGAKPLANTDLALRLGLSPGAVSQRKAKIQQMLDERFQVDPFGGNDSA